MSLAKKAKTNDDKITNGISLLIVPSPTFIGKTKAVQPIIIRILKILLPTTLPIAISALPLMDDNKLMTNSGADVPKATMVKPITKSEIRNFFATAAEPSVNALAPIRISANPPIKQIKSNMYFILNYTFSYSYQTGPGLLPITK